MVGTLLLDYLFAVSAYRKFILAVELIAAALALPTWLITKKRGPVVAFAALTIMVLVLPFVPFAPGQPYLALFKGIRNGMTQVRVLEVLDAHYPNRSSDGCPSISRQTSDLLLLVRDPNDGRYNAELIVVDFEDDRVVSKRYLPD